MVGKSPQGSQVAPLFGSSAHDLFHDQRAGDAASSRRKSRGLHRDIVIGNDGRNRFPGHLARHVEVHDVALIILDDEQYAATGVRSLSGGEDEIRRRRGKHLTGTCGIQHSLPYESAVTRLLFAAATPYPGY